MLYCDICGGAVLPGGMQYQIHPMRRVANHKKIFIPISMHGDATPASGAGKSWSKMMDIWSWSSMLTSSPSRLNSYLIFCIHACFRDAAADHNTLDVIFRKMAWSFKACYTGKWPTRDWNNKEISDPKASLSFSYLTAVCHLHFFQLTFMCLTALRLGIRGLGISVFNS